MEDFEKITEYPDVEENLEEKPESKPLWKKILVRSGTVLTALVVLFSVFYIYGGFRQLFFYKETPAGMSQVSTEAKLDAEVITVPLNILVLKNSENGSRRSRDEINNLVDDASKVWDQGAIDFEVSEVESIEVSSSELNPFFNSPRQFIRSLGGYNENMINVILLRRLRGINGIAFSGIKTLAVADLTTVYDFRVLAHEVGHIFGLSHVEDKSQLMYQGANSFELKLGEIKEARERAKELKLEKG